jgi:secondary thiamine-phosphate synthase enzyme|tara:strand:+ start:94 stop:543 length:450 start_codon:yes stop_codon:yes gene_type:complete
MKKIIKIKTGKLFTNITSEVSKFTKEWGKSGIVNVFSKHTTFSIWCTEDELLHKVDVRFFLDKLAPIWKDPEGEQKNIKYLHDLISLRDEAKVDERINGHSHIRSMFFNSSETIPVEKGELVLGIYKQIFAIELDGIRNREIICSFIEE